MKIKLKIGVTFVTKDGSTKACRKGDVVDVDATTGKNYIALDWAEKVSAGVFKKASEVAAVESDSEKAAKPKAKRTRKKAQ